MMKSLFKLKPLLMIGLQLCFLAACTPNGLNRAESINALATSNGFEKKLVQGDLFLITTYQRVTNVSSPYVFYIEGDGLAFQHGTVSDNPTPLNPMLLKLAMLDTRPNVVYVARPCQYTPMELNPNCSNEFWHRKRMSEEVVRSINTVINTISNEKPFHLIGYSGGGGVAVLVAARNEKTKDILTIAANLDHVAFNKLHNTLPMTGSLNPIDFASKLKRIPQLHVAGLDDTRVPPSIIDEYVSASSSPCVHKEFLPGVSHGSGWDKFWPKLLKTEIQCAN